MDKIPEILRELTVQHFPQTASWGPFAISNYTVFLVLMVIVTAIFWIVASRRAARIMAEGGTGMDLVPHGISNAAEFLVDFVRNSICIDVIGEEGKKYFPFIGTIFVAVLFSNLLGLIPGAKAATGITGTTFTWGLIVFVVYNAIGFRKQGAWGYVKSFVPSGVPMWLVPFMFPLEVLTHFLRPVTLGIRLFANIYAGHVVLGVFALFSALLFRPLFQGHLVLSSVVGILPMLATIAMYAFELFVAAIQAYVFAILTAVYIQGALHAH